MKGVRAVFRPAQAGSARWQFVKTLGQIAVFWTVFLAVLPLGIVRLEGLTGVPGMSVRVPSWVCWAVFAAASILGLCSAWVMATRGLGTPLPLDCPSRLVTSGPYAHVRNPMAIAGLVQGAAVGLLFQSWGVLLYVVCGMLVWDRLVRPVEEQDLLRRFGPQFEQYRRSVPCWRFNRAPYRADR